MEGHVWRSAVGGAEIENLADVSRLLFLLLCMNEKGSSRRHRAKGTDCPAVSAEASGQQITFPAWETIYYPLDFLICTSKKIVLFAIATHLLKKKKRTQTEAGGGKNGTTDGLAVDWIVWTHCPSSGITLLEIFCLL